MNSECKLIQDRLVAVAFGENDVEAKAHANLCTGCAQFLAELRSIQTVSAVRVQSAPSDVLAAAIGIVGDSSPGLVRLIASNLATAGVRAAAAVHEVQLVFETPVGIVRVQYTKEGKAWVASCELPEGVELIRRGTAVPVNNGIAEFGFARPQESSFVVRRGNIEAKIPSFNEAADLETH